MTDTPITPEDVKAAIDRGRELIGSHESVGHVRFIHKLSDYLAFEHTRANAESARADALHEALRRNCIEDRMCHECGTYSTLSVECHDPDCLASPKGTP